MRFASRAIVMPTARWCVLVVAGCGTSDSSAASYRRSADAACRKEVASIARLPTLQHEQHLTVTELEAIARRSGAAFIAAMRALRPPSALTSAHRKLIADLSAPSPTDTALTPSLLSMVLAHDRLLLGDYTKLRLSGCSDPLRAQMRRVMRAR
jgi:hypothetical protein